MAGKSWLKKLRLNILLTTYHVLDWMRGRVLSAMINTITVKSN